MVLEWLETFEAQFHVETFEAGFHFGEHLCGELASRWSFWSICSRKELKAASSAMQLSSVPVSAGAQLWTPCSWWEIGSLMAQPFFWGFIEGCWSWNTARFLLVEGRFILQGFKISTKHCWKKHVEHWQFKRLSLYVEGTASSEKGYTRWSTERSMTPHDFARRIWVFHIVPQEVTTNLLPKLRANAET